MLEKTATKAHILAVEDNQEVLRFLIRILKLEGHTSVACSDGREALEALQREDFDLVLLDAQLPDMSGSELCKKFIDKNIPVIVLTAYATVASAVELLKAGASDYLTKPVSVEQLTSSVRSVLETANQQKTQSQNVESNTVAVPFTFPEEVKVPCEQYLLYFVEFLRYIGIEATANLQEDAGRVLFSVTPKDKDEALDNIWEALAIYLRLPMNRNATVVVSPETSIEAQKLSAQLGFLQSQFQLANATIQQKELTIQQKDLIIQQQQSLIASGQVFIQSLQKEVEEDDAEPILGDIVKVKPWSVEGIPLEADLPTLLRRLKEKFGRNRLR